MHNKSRLKYFFKGIRQRRSSILERVRGNIEAADRAHSQLQFNDTGSVKFMRAGQLSSLRINHGIETDRARRPIKPSLSLDYRLRLPVLRGHALLLVAALLPVLGLTLGPAVAHELAAGARAEDDAGLLGEAAVGALPATRQRLLRVGHE